MTSCLKPQIITTPQLVRAITRLGVDVRWPECAPCMGWLVMYGNHPNPAQHGYGEWWLAQTRNASPDYARTWFGKPPSFGKKRISSENGPVFMMDLFDEYGNFREQFPIGFVVPL